jgi:hypothetical protein
MASEPCSGTERERMTVDLDPVAEARAYMEQARRPVGAARELA